VPFKYQKHQKHQKHLMIAAAVIFIGLTLLMFPKTVTVKSPNPKRYPIIAARVQRSNFHPHITLYGYLTSKHQTQLAASSKGKVIHVYIKHGDHVTKGQTLIKIDEHDLLLDQRTLLAKTKRITTHISLEKQKQTISTKNLALQRKLVILANKDHHRYQQLLQHNATTPALVEKKEQYLLQQQQHESQLMNNIQNHKLTLFQLHSQLTEITGKLSKLQKVLNESEVKAPFSGIVSHIHINQHDSVQTNQPLLSMYDNHALEAVVRLPKKYRPQFHTNAHITGHNLEHPQQHFIFKRLSGYIPENTLSEDAIFKLTSKPTATSLGQPISLKITLPLLHNVFRLPHSALFATNDLFAIHKGHLQKIQVQLLGQQTNQPTHFILFQSQKVKPGALFLAQPLANAVDGLAVKVIKMIES
jgi:membrane fusion protein, multidrug efflux system